MDGRQHDSRTTRPNRHPNPHASPGKGCRATWVGSRESPISPLVLGLRGGKNRLTLDEVFPRLIRFQLLGHTFELCVDPARPYLMQLRLPNVRSERVADKIIRRFPQAMGHWDAILAGTGAYHAQCLVYDPSTADRLTREVSLAKAIHRAADQMIALAQCFNDHVDRATSKPAWRLSLRLKTKSR